MTQVHSLQDLGDILEPYDVNYISNVPSEIPQLSAYEKRFCRKVGVLQNALRKAGVRGMEWDADEECFLVWRNTEDGRSYRRWVFINMEEGLYVFGDEFYDYDWDTKASVVAKKVAQWQSRTK